MPASAEVERTQDVLDDALYDLKIYRIKRNVMALAVTLASLFLLGTITCGVLSAVTDAFNHTDIGPAVAGFTILGIVFVAVSVIALSCVLDQNKRGRLQKATRKARRLYDAAVARDAEAQAKATAEEHARILKQFEEDQIRRTLRMGEVAFGTDKKEGQ